MKVGHRAALPVPAPKGDAGGFDPAAHTVGDVIDYVFRHPEERAAILELEAAGKARSTLLAALEAT